MVPMIPIEYIVVLVNWLMSDSNPLWKLLERYQLLDDTWKEVTR